MHPVDPKSLWKAPLWTLSILLAMLAMLGLVFAASLAIWLVVMVVVSLISSVFTGRPAAVTVLWRRYREMTRQRWPQQHPGSATPRADAADVTGASEIGRAHV